MARAKPLTESELKSVYFDTNDRRLQRNGMTLRVRNENGRRIQTLKMGRSTSWGLHRVSELSTDIHGNCPEPEKFSDQSIRNKLEAVIGRRRLRPVFETNVKRVSRLIETNVGMVEVAIDAGEFSVDDRQEPISEVEFELVDGRCGAVYIVAEDLLGHVPALLISSSKAERGYAVADKLVLPAPSPVRTNYPPALTNLWTLDVVEAYLAKYAEALAINLYCTFTQPAMEGPHQTRVTLRRLRALLWLASPALNKAFRDRLIESCRSYGRLLAPLRNADVFVDEIATPLLASDPELVTQLKNWRCGVRRDVAQALRNAQASGLPFSILACIREREWCAHRKKKRRHLLEPFGAMSADRLEADWAQLRSARDQVAKLKTRQRHELRKRLKRFRYALEIAAPTLPDRYENTAKTLARLRKVQNHLGRLNDLDTIAPMTPDLGNASANNRLKTLVKQMSQAADSQSSLLLSELEARWVKLCRTMEF